MKEPQFNDRDFFKRLCNVLDHESTPQQLTRNEMHILFKMTMQQYVSEILKRR